jgi:cytochrome c peroxidase
MMGNRNLRVLAVFAAAVVCFGGLTLCRSVSAAGDGGASSPTTGVTQKASENDAHQSPDAPPWERDNPVRPLPREPLGIDRKLSELPEPPTPERVRFGRWLFYDTRLSGDGTLSCATCHRPEHAFSETTPVSAGIHGQKGTRKAPSFVNEAWTIFPNFFWDGRASSLEEQALGPIANPIEMGSTHDTMVSTLGKVQAYSKYFREAFGDGQITKERVAKAIADYERTRMSGNSPWDRWQRRKDNDAVSDKVKQGHELFFNKAACNQCHLGQNFTDSSFHNLGVGYDQASGKFKDEGRALVTKKDDDRGAFKTPTLRDVAKHAPYMHDGSEKTLRDVVEFYNRGGNRNPHLDGKIHPLSLSSTEVDALVAFLEALNGEGYQDQAPKSFPQ